MTTMTRTNKLVRVTPKLAQEWLVLRNRKNRSIYDSVVDKYAHDMEQGLWKFTGDPIQFDTEGYLLNGQHRLSAIVKSGKTHEIWIWEGLDPTAQDAMDSGRVRLTGQQLSMDGIHHGNSVSAIVRILLKWESEDLMGRIPPSTGMVKQFIERNPDLCAEATSWAVRVARNVAIGRGPLGAFIYRALKLAEDYPEYIKKEEVEDFLEKLRSGANLDSNDPILILRTTSARYRMNHVRRTPARDLFNLVRTWNAVRAEETYNKLTGPRNGTVTMEHLILQPSVGGEDE